MLATVSATANVMVFKHVAMRRRTCVALEFIAHKKTDTELTEQNKQAMALTHGFAHGVVQSVLFSIRYAHIPLDSASTRLVASHTCIDSLLVANRDEFF